MVSGMGGPRSIHKPSRRHFRTPSRPRGVRPPLPPDLDHEITPVTCMPASRHPLINTLAGRGLHVYRYTAASVARRHCARPAGASRAAPGRLLTSLISPRLKLPWTSLEKLQCERCQSGYVEAPMLWSVLNAHHQLAPGSYGGKAC